MTHYVIQLDDHDLAVIAAALGELPMKVAKATFDKIDAQVAEAKAATAQTDQPQD